LKRAGTEWKREVFLDFWNDPTGGINTVVIR